MPDTRTRRVEPMLNPTTCCCHNGRPTLIATFTDQRLTDVRRRHDRGCGMAAVVLDPREFERGARRGNR